MEGKTIFPFASVRRRDSGGRPAQPHPSCWHQSNFLLSFLESVPGLADRLREPRTGQPPFEEVVNEVEKATVVVLVY